MAALQSQTGASKTQATTPNTNKGLQVCKHCKKLAAHNDDDCNHLKMNKEKRATAAPKNILEKLSKTKAKKSKKPE